MIAYDFDGVICPDLNIDWKNNNVDVSILHSIRKQVCPIFTPTGKFIVITGRPSEDFDETYNWCRMFNIFPDKIYFNPGNPDYLDDVCVHKSKVINSIPGIDLFVESDHKQVMIISQMTDVKVIHFPTFISKIINENK